MEIVALQSLPLYLRTDIVNGIPRSLCPTCGGGRTHERSLSIRPIGTHDQLVKLACWRSTCDWYAVTPTTEGVKLSNKRRDVSKVYDGPLVDLCGTDLYDMLRATYGLTRHAIYEHGWSTDGQGTLVMPVRAPSGGNRGCVTRTFDSPKRCMTYKNTAQPFLDWWLPGSFITAVVEDGLSACRLAGLGFGAVALLGTNMSTDAAIEIATYAGSEVYLALDNDAFEKSLKLEAKHRHIVRMRPVLLTRDIKNMDSDSDIKELFSV